MVTQREDEDVDSVSPHVPYYTMIEGPSPFPRAVDLILVPFSLGSIYTLHIQSLAVLFGLIFKQGSSFYRSLYHKVNPATTILFIKLNCNTNL